MSRRRLLQLIIEVTLFVLLLGCGIPIATSEPPTLTPTPIPPTATPVPLTPTPIPPTATLTPLPPTETPTLPTVEMIEIPAGPFTMGNDNAEADEAPAHTVDLPAFQIDKFEVTNANFAVFVENTGYVTYAETRKDSTNWRQEFGFGEENHPVVRVTFDDAVAYCTWAGKRLPTETEWEKAARGTDGRLYPWGDEFDGSRLNYCDKNCIFNWKDKKIDDGYINTAPVGSLPTGASPYGVEDMAGNVSEWTADWYQAYPGNTQTNEYYGEQLRVIRGGSWRDEGPPLTVTYRDAGVPNITANDDLGFRCAK